MECCIFRRECRRPARGYFAACWRLREVSYGPSQPFDLSQSGFAILFRIVQLPGPHSEAGSCAKIRLHHRHSCNVSIS